MHHSINYLILLMLVGLAGAQQPTTTPQVAKATTSANIPSEETVNAFLHEWFGYDPTLTWKVVSIKPSEIEGLSEVNAVLSGNQGTSALKLYVTPDGKHAVTGQIMPFGAHPFAADRKKLEAGANGPPHGSANASVTVVEFSDLQCPHCKEAQPTLDKLMAEDKNVRVIFQNYPLPMHDWAAKAAAYADCVSRSSNDAFWKFISSVYGAQTDITAANADEKLTALADAAGAKGADAAACAAKPETTSRVEKSMALGKDLDVDSTPTLFINGRRVPAVPYETLQKLVDFAAKDNADAKK
jgi:protein-disulfide isomerase